MVGKVMMPKIIMKKISKRLHIHLMIRIKIKYYKVMIKY